MILGSQPLATIDAATLASMVAAAGYVAAALPAKPSARWPSVTLALGWLAHFIALVLDIGGWGQELPGPRLGFAPVLSITVWLVIAVHTVESRWLPLPSVRMGLAAAGALAVVVAAAYPGELRRFTSPLGPFHFVLGVASYGLFGAAVLHALMLDASERGLRLHKSVPWGLPLMQLERLTFRFVDAGFIVLTATLVLGVLAPGGMRFNHKTVLSVLAWLVFASLLAGHRLHGWRGRRATRWIYGGALLLMLAYVGSRFVFEVLLERPAV